MITGDPGLSVGSRSFVLPRSGQLSVLVAFLWSWPALSPGVGSPLRRRHLLQDLFEKQETFFFFFNRKLLEFSKTRHPSILPPFLPSSQLSVSLLAMVTVAVGPASIETVFLWQRERGWKGTLARAQGQLLWEA